MFVTLIIILGLGIVAIGYFNRFVRLKNLMKEAWSGIDVQLKRRHDLIPQVVEVVQGYAKHEKTLLENITRFRTASGGENPNQQKVLETDLSGALRKIFALSEAYPDLKANQNFLALQKTLIEIEDQIQLARRYYNGTVRDNNILVETFPSNLVALPFGFKMAPYFEIEYATERKSPDMKF